MMDQKALRTATAIGTLLQLAMIAAGHYVPFVRDQVFMLGGLAISLVAGLIYALRAKPGWSSALLGGAIAGGVSALIGIAASVLLKDTLPMILVVGTLSSTVTGLIGGAIGKLMTRAAPQAA
jgi:hypothetical protein